MKLRCEGTSPCKSCTRRGTQCVKSALTTARSTSAESIASASHAVDPGSIKFLLNEGEAGFIADWRIFGGRVSPKTGPVPRPATHDFGSVVTGQNDTDYYVDNTISGLFEAFESGPFEAFHAEQVNLQPDKTTITWPLLEEGQSIWSGMLMHDDNGFDHVVASALINALTEAISRLALDLKTQQYLISDINYLMVPERIRRFIDMYKNMWHFNCPIVHVANFVPENVQTTLLVPVVMMGALYTSDERELAAAKNLLDVAEVYCFSSGVLSPELEISRSLQGRQGDETSDWNEFQQFQGAYLIVAMQFWAGSQAARNRAMECRFSEVIKVVRSMGLTKVRHHTEDQYDQELWIRRECKIRTMNILFCLDCAFLFFRSFPCRLSFTELDFELCCEEPIFNAPQPFQHPRFGRRSPMTLKQGVEFLSRSEPVLRNPSDDTTPFTMLSMFILIHMLYAFISNRLSLPWLNGTTMAANGKLVSGSDSFLAKIKIPLARWAEYWEVMLATTSGEAWQMAGLFRNGLKYHMVAMLLVQKHQAIEGDELMVPKCADKWERMSALA